MAGEFTDKNKKMVYDIEHGIPGWDNFVEFAGLDKIFVTSVKTEKKELPPLLIKKGQEKSRRKKVERKNQAISQAG